MDVTYFRIGCPFVWRCPPTCYGNLHRTSFITSLGVPSSNRKVDISRCCHFKPLLTRCYRIKKIDKAHGVIVGLMRILLDKQKKQTVEEFEDTLSRRRDVASLMLKATKLESKAYMSDDELVCIL